MTVFPKIKCTSLIFLFLAALMAYGSSPQGNQVQASAVTQAAIDTPPHRDNVDSLIHYATAGIPNLFKIHKSTKILLIMINASFILCTTAILIKLIIKINIYGTILMCYYTGKIHLCILSSFTTTSNIFDHQMSGFFLSF